MYLMKEVRSLTYYLLNNEFKNDKGTYHSWFKECSSMYAQELIYNHYFSDNFLYYGLDIKPYFNRKIGNNDYHIHAFPTPSNFSKEKFFKKLYNKNEYKKYDFNIIKGYCFYITQLNINKLAKYF